MSARASSLAARNDLLACGAVVLHVPSREVRHGAARTTLQEQPFQILRMLLAQPGAVVTREDLRRQLWPDGTFVDFDHSLNAAIKRLRAALGDDARTQSLIETLPRRGYRWKAGPTRERREARVVVLPFAEGDGAGGFSSGLSDELIAQLGDRGAGRIRVVARLSVLACANAMVRARDLANSLDADYLLEGSVRRDGDRVRIVVWLVDAREEVQTWRDVYERPLAEPMPVQVELATTIARSVVETVVAS